MLALITAAGSSGGSSVIDVSCPVTPLRYYNHLSDLIAHWSTSAQCWYFECLAEAAVFHCRMTSENSEKSRRAALFQRKVNMRQLSTFAWFTNPPFMRTQSIFTIYSFVVHESDRVKRRPNCWRVSDISLQRVGDGRKQCNLKPSFCWTRFADHKAPDGLSMALLPVRSSENWIRGLSMALFSSILHRNSELNRLNFRNRNNRLISN
jgi:hypothetical protein